MASIFQDIADSYSNGGAKRRRSGGSLFGDIAGSYFADDYDEKLDEYRQTEVAKREKEKNPLLELVGSLTKAKPDEKGKVAEKAPSSLVTVTPEMVEGLQSDYQNVSFVAEMLKNTQPTGPVKPLDQIRADIRAKDKPSWGETLYYNLLSGAGDVAKSYANIPVLAEKLLDKAIPGEQQLTPRAQRLQDMLAKTEELQSVFDESQAKAPLIQRVAGGITRSLPSIGSAALTGNVAGSVPVMFGIQAGSNYEREAEAEGADPLQASAYGAVMGTVEALTEKIPFEEMMAAFGGKGGVKAMLRGMTAEGLQEVVTNPLQVISKRLFYNGGQQEPILDTGRELESFLTGAGTMGVLHGMGHVNQLLGGRLGKVVDDLRSVGTSDLEIAGIVEQAAANQPITSKQPPAPAPPGNNVTPAQSIPDLGANPNPQATPNQPHFPGYAGMFTSIAQPARNFSNETVETVKPVEPVNPVQTMLREKPKRPNPSARQTGKYQPGDMIVDAKGRKWKIVSIDGSLVNVENAQGTNAQIGLGAIKGRVGGVEAPVQPVTPQAPLNDKQTEGPTKSSEPTSYIMEDLDDMITVQKQGDKRVVTFKYPYSEFTAEFDAEGSYNVYYKHRENPLDTYPPMVKKVLDKIADKTKEIGPQVKPNNTHAKPEEPVYNEVEKVMPLSSNLKEVDALHFDRYVETVDGVIQNIKQSIDKETFPKGARVQGQIRGLVSKELGRVATEDEVTDLVEAAVQWHIYEQVKDMPIEDAITKAHQLEAKLLPKFSRSMEKTQRQQFSTPVSIALAAANVAGIKGGDRVIEGSAGTGSLIEAVLSKNPDIAMTAVELEPRRAAVLEALKRRVNLKEFNVINDDTFNYMPKEKADVVIMNPPFRGASRMTNSERGGKPPWPGGWGDLGNRFIYHDLRRLKDGGRLVSITSPGVVDMDNKVNIPFRQWLKNNHTVRAFIVFPTGTYDTRGTTFGSGLLIVDKGKKTTLGEPVVGKPETWEEFFKLMKGVRGREVVSSGRQLPQAPSGTGDASQSGGGNRAKAGTSGFNRGVRSDAAPQVSRRPGSSGHSGPGSHDDGIGLKTSTAKPADELFGAEGIPETPLQNAEVTSQGGRKRVQPVVSSSDETPQPRKSAPTDANRSGPDGTDITEVKFVKYVAEKVSGRNTPGKVVEPPTLAFVKGPEYLKIDPNLKPHPRVIVGNKELGMGLSDIQLETVMAAKYSHRNGRGLLIADDVGVGKTGSILGILGDGYFSGEFDRQVLVVKGEDFVGDNLVDDIRKFNIPIPYTFVRQSPEYDDHTANDYAHEGSEESLTGKVKEKPISDFAKHKLGSVWKPFPDKGGILVLTKEDLKKYSYAIYDWLKKSKKESRIVVDEAHYFKNTPDEDTKNKGADMGAVLRGLWRSLKPEKGTQFIYCSATSGESLDDIEYLYDLGLWDASPNSFEQWKAGLTGEVFTGSRRSGRFGPGKNDPFSRNVPLTIMEQIIRELKSKGQYFGRQQALDGVEIEALPVKLSPKQVGEINSLVDFISKLTANIKKYQGSPFKVIGGVLQYMRRISGHYRLLTAIEDVKRRLAEAERRGEKIRIAFSVDQFNSVSSRAPGIENLIEYVPTAFRDDTGETIEIPEAKWDKEELRAILDGQNPEYPNPLPELPDMIAMIKGAFGGEKVAVINGSASAKQRNLAKQEFRSLKRPIVVFSKAGSTGINLHDETGNRVYMYHVDYDYDATTFKQREGRFNRTGQKTAPVFIYPYINSGIDTRFIGTIMARMQQMGAIARGKTGEVTNADLQQFNITGAAAKLATVRALIRLNDDQRDTILGVTDNQGEEFEKQSARISAKDYMNRIMLLPMADSAEARNIFMDELAAVRQEVENIGGIIDQFTTYKGKILSESKAGNIRLLRVATTDPKIIEQAGKNLVEAEAKYKAAQKLLDKAAEDGKKKVEENKTKAFEQSKKKAENEKEQYQQYSQETDPKKREELYNKYREAMNRASEARQRYSFYQYNDINTLLMNLPEYSRVLRKFEETKRRYDTAQHNVDYSKEAVLIDGQVVTTGLMPAIRQAIDRAGRNKNVPSEARRLEFRGYILEGGSRAVGPVIPEFAEEEVAQELGAELKAKEIGENEIWNAVTEKRKTVHLSGGVSLEYSDYLKSVVIKGISSTANDIKEWYKTVVPDVSFNPVSRVFTVNNETGLEKVLKKWPVKSQSALEIADAEIERRIAESGVRLREGNSDVTSIASKSFEWARRLKNAMDALSGDDSGKIAVSDAEVERVLSATKSPLNLRQQVKTVAHGVATGFKDVFEYEWTVKEFPQFQDELRRFKGVARDAQKFALDKLLKITAFLDNPRDYEIFRRLVFLRDLEAGLNEKEAEAFAAAKRMGINNEEIETMLEDYRENAKTTGNLTANQIQKAMAELWKQAGERSSDRIKNALWAHDKTFEALWEDLQERGKVPENAKHREHYVPHRVLDYMQEVDKRFPALSRRFKTPYRYYLNKRTGSARLIDTDYTALTLKHFAKLYMDNAYDDFNLDIAARYDEYAKMTKEQRTEAGKLIPNRLYEVDGKQFRAWQYDPGRNYYLQESISEETVMDILQSALDAEVKEEDRQKLYEAALSQATSDSKTFLAVGRHKRIYLLPVEIADRLTHFKAPDFNSRTLNAVRTFHHFYKMMLFSPVTLGIPFHVNNAFGDALNLIRDDPGAMKYLADAWKATGEWQSGEVSEQFKTVVELAEKYRVAESGLMKQSGMPYHPHLKQLQPKRYRLRRLNPLTKWNDLAERRELTPRFAKLMADIERINRGEMPVARYVDVTKLVKAGMSVQEVSGKLAREITVDYDKLTPEGKGFFRDIAMPFFTFYVENFGNWFKYVRRNPDNFAVKFMIPLLGMILWNWLRFPDEEDKLPPYYRVVPHVITGFKDKDGKMIIWSMQTPVEMAARIAGLDTFPDLVRQVVSGKKKAGEAAVELAKNIVLGPYEAAKDLFTPLFKAPIEAYANKSMFNGRPIVPKQLQGTKAETKARWKYIFGQWFAPAGNWARNTKDDNGLKKNIGDYLTRGPVDIGRAFGVRHVDAGREQINRFYDRLEELEGEYKLWRDKREKGVRQAAYDSYYQLARLRKYSSKFSMVWKYIRRLEASKMPKDQKERLVNQRVDSIAKMAESALKTVRK